MNLSKLSLNQLVNLSLAVFLFLSVAATTYTVNQVNNLNAEAARGGGGGGGKGGGKGGGGYAGSCLITPNPAPIGSSITISGSGFRPLVGLGIAVSGAGGTQMGFAYSDVNGSFSTPWSATWLGTESVSIKDGTLGSASCSFTVQ